MKKACCCALLLAWTLWTRTQSPTADSWVAEPGFATPDKCQANVKDKLETWKQFKDSKFGKNSVTFIGNDTTMAYFCLPESEDPRKAKTGKSKTAE